MKTPPMLLSCLIASLVGCGQESPTPQSPPSTVPKAAFSKNTLDEATKNRIWWDVERSTGEVDQLFDEMAQDAKDTSAMLNAMERAEKKVRSRIASEYGTSYDVVKEIFDEGESAAWRTETPPD